MQIDLATAGLLGSVLTILIYAAGGFVYSLTGLGKGKVKYGDITYDFSKAKYPILFFTGAGVLVVLFGAEFAPGTLDALAVFLAFIVDQFRQMFQAASQTYSDELAEGRSQKDALYLAVRDGLEAGDPEQILAALQGVRREYGDPSTENVRERSEELQESYRRGGTREVYGDHFSDAFDDEDEDGTVIEPEDEEIDAGRREAMTSPLRAHDEDRQDNSVETDEEHYVNDGDGDGSEDSDSDSDDVVTSGP